VQDEKFIFKMQMTHDDNECVTNVIPRLHDTTGCQTGCTTRFGNRFDDRVERSTGCQTRFDNRFDNGFYNRLYRVYKDLLGCQTVLTTGCIV